MPYYRWETVHPADQTGETLLVRLCLPIPPPSISAWLNVGSLIGHYSRGAARMAGPVAFALGRVAASASKTHRRPTPGPTQSTACGACTKVKVDTGAASPQSCPNPASHVRHSRSLPESRTDIVGSAARAAVATPPPPRSRPTQSSTDIVGAAAGELKARPLHTVLPTRLWSTLGRWICMFGKSSSGLGFVPEIRWQPMVSLSPLPRIPSAASAYSCGSVEALKSKPVLHNSGSGP